MATVQREVTFRQCQGKTRSGSLVKFAQDEILLNGRRIGYVGHGHSESATLLAPVDDETRQIISESIKNHRGTAPLKVISAPIIPDEAEGDGDE